MRRTLITGLTVAALATACGTTAPHATRPAPAGTTHASVTGWRGVCPGDHVRLEDVANVPTAGAALAVLKRDGCVVQLERLGAREWMAIVAIDHGE